MKNRVEDIKDKRILLKSFQSIKQIENVIKQICSSNIDDIQISVLGKVEDINLDTNFADSWTKLKSYCSNKLRLNSNFGMVFNPEIGTYFIAGFLEPMFLQEINGKTIGAMPAGFYGILRGLGIDKENVSYYSQALNKGDLLLVIRGDKSKITKLKPFLV
ncbi:hypothetical protein [Lacinutrix algicola]|uniref:hypothetical protein n=1 Tax=Lacinutrix algicola TaxID=342954 RepID=UPI0006E36244|nr:hypothetical protein [Lacinutrix algicola]